ncbi:MAG: hypothetical protein ABIV13_02605 [Fimbriimonadales bacterium]
MLKKLCFLSVLCFAALAAASHILAIGSHGSGTATTQDGRNGSFHFSVVKRTAKGHHPTFEGSLRFEQHHNNHGPWILVEMGRPSVVSGGKGGVCEFAGTGSLTRVVEGHQQTVHGTVTARVVDRRNPHHTPHNPADLIRVSFVDKHNQTFTFDGTVHSGDLAVFSRQEH